MVVVQVVGGLGNQLFQYSLGRCLAERNRTRLKLDTSAFAGYPLRRFVLEHFFIEADVLSGEELQQLGRTPSSRRSLHQAMDWLLRRQTLPIIKERSFRFQPEVLQAKAPCYLEGYWQSPKYFAPIESLIRKEVTVREPLTGENRRVADGISATCAVSLHVRRGDYISNEVTNRYHGICGPGYFYAAEDFLRTHLGEFVLFIFSDDPTWVAENLRFASPTVVVRHNDVEQDYEDLRLMTLCRHHIISNSTFSWWGAWLCQHPQKIVVAPKQWFREATHGTEDLIPSDWIRL
jgi:hypothetical protein